MRDFIALQELVSFSVVTFVAACTLSLQGCANSESTGLGQDCKSSRECRKGLVCSGSECVEPGPDVESVEAWHQRYERELEQKRIAELEKNVDLLRQSGLDPNLQLESAGAEPALSGRPKAGAKAGRGSIGPIRVSNTKGLSPIFAACRADERLIGGGCRAGTTSISIGASHPSGFSEQDTLGARWECEGRASLVEKELEAYALCVQTTR